MKILIVTNLYPPYYHGGYEVRCKQVAEALQHVGHDVRVFTSAYGLPVSPLGHLRPRYEEIRGVRVYRYLNQYIYKPQPVLRPGRLFGAKRHLWDAQQFQKLLRSFQPDIVNWWSMYGLSMMLLPLPQAWRIPDVHWIEHWWMIRQYGPDGEKAAALWSDFWDGSWGPQFCRPFFRWAGKRWEQRFEQAGMPTRQFPNRPRHVCFVSEYLRTLHYESGFAFPSSEVIHGGVPVAQFYEPVNGQRHASDRLQLLYAGQISPDRGLHTVVEALGHLASNLRSRLRLSVVGGSSGYSSSCYFSHVKTQVEASGLTNCVSFLGKIPHEQMPHIYKQHDVLVFPSTRPEGLPLTMVEAMLAGCAVLTTGSGGAMEIATMAELPLFPQDNSLALSQLLSHLVLHRARVPEIAVRGQKVALREFSFERMMARWCITLQRLCKSDETYV